MNMLNRPTMSVIWILIAFCLGVLLMYTTSKTNFRFRPLEAIVKWNPVIPTCPTKPVTFDDFLGVSQEDPELITFIREKVLQPPSNEPYKLKHPELKHFGEHGQSQWLDETIFKGKRNGFFIEVGAINGEFLSNTLYFERELGWTGLLIEPNHDTFEELMKKGRKSYKVNSALSPIQSPSQIILKHVGLAGKESIISKDDVGQRIKTYPLYSLLKAINISTVDFFSLDIESQEMPVLRTLPWDKIKFKVLCIETIHLPEGRDVLVKFIEEKGYKLIGQKTNDAWFIAKDLWNANIRI